MRLWTTILTLVLLLPHAEAQVDTATLSLHSLQVVPAATGAALFGMGSLLTFNPSVNTYNVGVRDAVVNANLPHIPVDDYLQYLTTATPVTLSLCGLKARHSTYKMALLEGGSYLLGAGWLNALKYKMGVMRPDGSACNSFPSGHTFVAFTGAEILRREYGKDYPWIAAAGYTVAALVGALRIYNNRHWAGDVLAGAGLGVLSVTLTYWLFDN